MSELTDSELAELTAILSHTSVTTEQIRRLAVLAGKAVAALRFLRQPEREGWVSGMESAKKICDDYADKWRMRSDVVGKERSWAADTCSDLIAEALQSEEK